MEYPKDALREPEHGGGLGLAELRVRFADFTVQLEPGLIKGCLIINYRGCAWLLVSQSCTKYALARKEVPLGLHGSQSYGRRCLAPMPCRWVGQSYDLAFSNPL